MLKNETNYLVFLSIFQVNKLLASILLYIRLKPGKYFVLLETKKTERSVLQLTLGHHLLHIHTLFLISYKKPTHSFVESNQRVRQNARFIAQIQVYINGRVSD